MTLLIASEITLGGGCIKRPRTRERSAPPVSTVENSRLINLNVASVDELETLPGIGEGIAERIVRYREQNGPFRRIEHLMMVQGISEQKFLAVRDRITV